MDSGKKNLSMLRHVKHDKKIWEEIKMAIMQEIETKLQKGISVSSNEEVYFALLDLFYQTTLST